MGYFLVHVVENSTRVASSSPDGNLQLRGTTGSAVCLSCPYDASQLDHAILSEIQLDLGLDLITCISINHSLAWSNFYEPTAVA